MECVESQSLKTQLKLKHINLAKELVFQDAKEVKTKFSKTIHSFFFSRSDESP